MSTIAKRQRQSNYDGSHFHGGPTLMNLKEGDVKKGMVFYRHERDIKNYEWMLYCPHIITSMSDGPYPYDTTYFSINAILPGNRLVKARGCFIEHLNACYMKTPSEKLFVLHGLALPDELAMEVFQYTGLNLNSGEFHC
jgi:hypothetical protein